MGSRARRRLRKATVLIVAVSAGILPAARSNGSPRQGGTQLWKARYNGPADDFDGAYALAMSPDGARVFVTGSSARTVVDYDYATASYDVATGARLWLQRYQGPAHSVDSAYSVAVSHDGSIVFVTGGSWGVSTWYDYATLAYDADTGARLWVKRYDGTGHGPDLAMSVAVSADDSAVFVTGESTEWPAALYDYVTLAYAARTGEELWVRSFGLGVGTGGGRSDDYAHAVVVSPDGSMVFVTGSIGLGEGDFGTVAYRAATGVLLWEANYDGPGHSGDAAWSEALSPDGSAIFVTGNSFNGRNADFATVAYDTATGRQLWVQRYDGPARGDDAANSLAVSPDGSTVFVTGESQGTYFGFLEFATLAYTTTGALLWVKRYSGPGGGDDVGRSVAVSPDGSTVFVTGESFGIDLDYATLAYSSGGDLLWEARYDGPGHASDYPYSVAVTPDGSRVLVAGQIWGKTSIDYTTVAYEA